LSLVVHIVVKWCFVVVLYYNW